MPATINVLNRAVSLATAPKFAAFTGVRLWYDDDQYFFAGDETGRVLEADNPWATQAMADSILAQVSGYAYQPFEAGAALLDPAAELGDGVNVGGVYGPLASITTRFDAMCTADIAAPADGDIEHEYPYLTPAQREYKRNKARTYSLISKTAEEIRLEVHSLRTDTGLALEELEKELNEELDWLSGEFTETLKSYSTITQTDSKISTAVSTSKTYTDSKTGEVVATLKNYSTVEQTDSKISTAVSTSKEYTNTQVNGLANSVNTTLKSYSTITQTDSKISTSVTTSKTYTDSKTGEVVASLKNYSTVEQTDSKISLAVTGLINETTAKSLIKQEMNKIELSVSSVNGSTTLKLTDGSAELTAQTLEISVNAAKINGKLTADQLNITGAITFDDLDASTQSKINNAGGSVPSYIKSTYIDKVTVRSPTIVGGTIRATSNSKYYAEMQSEAFALMGTDNDTPRAEIRAYTNLVEMVLGVGSDTGGENGRLHVMKGVGAINDGPEQNLGAFHFRNSSGVDSGLVLTDDSNFMLFSGIGNGKVYTDENGIVFDAGPVIVRIDNNNMRVNFYFKYDDDMNTVERTWFLDSSGLHK